MRPVDGEEFASLKKRASDILVDLSDHPDHPLIVHHLPGQALVEFVGPKAAQPALYFEDPLEFQHWFAALNGRTYTGPAKPRSFSEGFGILDLYQDPDFPANVPPLVREVLARKRLALDFRVEALDELKAAFDRKRSPRLGTKGIAYVALYFGETLRRAVGGEWTIEASKYGPELRIATPSGKSIDFLPDLCHDLDEYGSPPFPWYLKKFTAQTR